MPRLSQALDRAASMRPQEPQARETPVATNEEVLRRWHFDLDSPADVPECPPAAASPEPAWSLPSPAAAAPAETPSRVAPPADLAPTIAPSARRFRVSASDARKLVVGDDADPILVEQFRRLAAGLHNAQVQRHVRSVMIASGAAAEGKTLAATNLALTLSESFDRRVLLIDGDLRRPGVHKLLGVDNTRGLLDMLQQSDGGSPPIHQLTRRLWVLTAGQATSDPMSGLVSDAMKQLLADAQEQFDWVIVDTPPVALMPDAKLLASLVDGALLVIRANATPYSIVQRAVAAVGNDRIFGVLLNAADRSAFGATYGFYEYDYYHRASRGADRTGAFGESNARG